MPTATVSTNYQVQVYAGGARGPIAVPPAQHRSRLRIAGYRRKRPLWGPESLTPAELRVARHAAEGMSNPQIAALLFVTRGTVESQLHAVYRKLGIPGRHDLRAQLGVLAVDPA